MPPKTRIRNARQARGLIQTRRVVYVRYVPLHGQDVAGAEFSDETPTIVYLTLASSRARSFLAAIITTGRSVGFVGWNDGRAICDSCGSGESRRACAHATAFSAHVQEKPGTSGRIHVPYIRVHSP